MPQTINPLVIEIPWQEPLDIFRLFAQHTGAMFLDSAQQKPDYGQYSFIGIDPFLTLTGNNVTANPWHTLQQYLRQFPLTRLPELPPFQGGVAGYFGYELVQYLEVIPNLPASTIPDMYLGFFDLVLAFDLLQKKAWIFSSGYPEQDPSLRQQRAQMRLTWLLAQLNHIPILPHNVSNPAFELNIQSNFSASSYQQAVQQVIDYILAGDIFQANIAQRFHAEKPINFDPFELYVQLRTINPALFAAYINAGEVILASASPERFIKLRDRQVTTCPIKGTRPRGTTPEQDEFYKNELTISAKDRAENIMIVDLLRNDLSKVCADHTVQVPLLCGLESFATVHHLVSVITAELQPAYDAIDLLQATFPGGSITGAPKVRAMEIIATIEQLARGPYCGSIGYINFNGDMDTSIVIRSFVIDQEKISFHAGGGITADSDPLQEYAETLTKAKALMAVLRNKVE